jgi:lipoate---protein ligase
LSWTRVDLVGSAAELHARPFDPPATRTVLVLEVVRPALVLGSTQDDAIVDVDAAGRLGVDIARRHSGGGAVLLQPGAALWVDVEIPRDDPLWDDDVGRATWWLGDAWHRALGLDGLAVHRGALVRTPGSELVCFAGLGPGEVTTATGAKVVGIAQRRTRAGARFQCAVPLAWDAATLAALIPAAAGLDIAVHLVDTDPDVIAEALVAQLGAAIGS